MNPKDARLTSARFEALFLTVPRFTGVIRESLYLNLCKVFDFESCIKDGDTGVDIAKEGRRALRVDRDRWRLDEFELIGQQVLPETVADIGMAIKSGIKTSPFFESRLTLQAVWPMPEEGPDAGSVITKRAVGLTGDDFKRLAGTTLEGVGISIKAISDAFGHQSLAVGPSIVEGSNELMISLSSWKHDELPGKREIEERIVEFCNHFEESVKPFVQGFMD